MVTEMESLKIELLALPLSARAWLAQNLLASLPEPDASPIREVSFDELKRRLSEIKSGQVICRSGDEVLREARERLK